MIFFVRNIIIQNVINKNYFYFANQFYVIVL